MSDPMELTKQLANALEAVIETYDPNDDNLENAANVAYAQNMLMTVQKEIENYRTQPLPEDVLWQLAEKHINTHNQMYPIQFARAIEEQHGIGVKI